MATQIWNNVFSDSLEMRTTLTIVTPETDAVTGPSRLLILLHGLTGNNSQWPSRTDLQPLASRHNLTIAMPDGQRSFWINQAYGLRFGDWVGNELPQMLRGQLPIAPVRESTVIGGLSMGGYGAVRAAFDHPGQFAAAFSLSGTLDVAEPAFRERHEDLYRIGFGNPLSPRPEDNLIGRARDFGSETPEETTDRISIRDVKLFACCGTEDRLLDQNERFASVANESGLSLAYEVGPGGHEWGFWSHWLPIALDCLPPIS